MPPDHAPSLLALIRDSVATPQAMAERLLRLRLPLGRVLEAVALVSVLDALLVGTLGGGSFAVPMMDGSALTVGPLAYAALLAASLVLSAAAVQVAGQMLGGRGRLTESLLVIAWLEVVALADRLVQVLVLLLLPPLAGVVGLAGLAVLLWCLVHFVRVLHGFPGFGRTVGTLLLALLGIVIGLSMILGLFVAPAEAAHV